MKTLQKATAVLMLAGFAALVIAAATDRFDPSWWTADGGGDYSEANAYAVMGDIGQWDAGVMDGGTYRIEGGFLVPFPPPDDTAARQWREYE